MIYVNLKLTEDQALSLLTLIDEAAILKGDSSRGAFIRRMKSKIAKTLRQQWQIS